MPRQIVTVDSVKDIELLCIGNALVDIFAEVEGDPDNLFGLTAPVQHTDDKTIREILALLNDINAVAGGGASNVAKIASFLGVSSGFAGMVGSHRGEPDRFAKLFENELKEAGVELLLSRSPKPTGIFLMLRSAEGETRIVVSPSAALDLSGDDIVEESLQKARVVVLDGYMLGREGLIKRILELAVKHGTEIALDIGSIEMAKICAKDILCLCQEYPLILFMNEEESKAFYEALGSPEADPEDENKISLAFSGEWRQGDSVFRRSCLFFRKLTRGELYPIIVVKRGSRGAVVFAGGDIHRAETLPVIPLETTGAGDAFCAAFLCGWVRRRSLSECAQLGNRAAREVLDTPGTRIDPKRLAHLAKTLQASSAS
ncbi:adenosine kinase [Spirochaetia bacterium]|nr:adenosine kinase [Spirochaetia bacterium]